MGTEAFLKKIFLNQMAEKHSTVFILISILLHLSRSPLIYTTISKSGHFIFHPSIEIFKCPSPNEQDLILQIGVY